MRAPCKEWEEGSEQRGSCQQRDPVLNGTLFRSVELELSCHHSRLKGGKTGHATVWGTVRGKHDKRSCRHTSLLQRSIEYHGGWLKRQSYKRTHNPIRRKQVGLYFVCENSRQSRCISFATAA